MRVDSKERWTRDEWVATFALALVFPPMGFAALLRHACGLRVWR